MTTVTYDLVQDLRTADQVRRRFAAPIARLVELGFREACIYRESGPAYSALSSLPVSLLMVLRREVLGLLPPWRLSGAFPPLICSTPPTYANAFGLGVKFPSRFEDGSALVTATFASHLHPLSPGPLRKQARRMSGEAGWDWHRDSVEECVRDRRSVGRNLGFAGFVEVCRLVDQLAAT